MAIVTRACAPDELEAVVRLANSVFRSGESGDMQAEYPLMFAPNNLDGLRIAVEDGAPLALVGVCVREAVLLGARLRVASIGAVCTDPRYRGRGLASGLMEDARRYARDQGAALMLISGGRGLYHRLGYATVGRFDSYRISAVELGEAGPPDVELTEYNPEDLSRIAALYQAEPIRFLRPAADWSLLLRAGMLMNHPAELLLIRRDHEPIAYVGVLKPSRDADGVTRVVRIHELAGSRAAVLAALPALLRHYEAAAVSLVIQPTDTEMRFNAQRRGWKATRQSFPGTLGVIDPPALMSALMPVLTERSATEITVSTTEDSATFTLGDERYQVAAPGPMAALLFGGDTEEARALPPMGGALGQLLEMLFPLPLFWHGYNYV